MISSGDLPSIARQARSGSLSVDLDGPAIIPPGGEPINFAAPVKITLENGAFRCIIRLPQGFVIPDALASFFDQRLGGARIVGLEDCFRITGTTPDGLDVELQHVWPIPSRSHMISGASTSHEFGFNRINLPIRPVDPEFLTAQLRMLRGFLDDSDSEQGVSEEHPDGEAVPQFGAHEVPSGPQRDDVIAIVPSVKLLIRRDPISSVTTHPFFGESSSFNHSCFVGDLLGGTFCLEEKDGDVKILYRREYPHGKEGIVPASQVMSGLLDALKFTHSCQPWPYYYERQENDRAVERWVASSDSCHRDTLKPLSQADMHVSDEGRNLFICAAEYFAAESASAQRASRALWLMHDACRAGTPGEIRLITLCSILEGLIHALEERLLSPAERERTVPRTQKWQLILQRLNLPWDRVFARVYDSWSYYRHPLAHGFQERSADSPDRYFEGYSRISGAIYILMAQEMGYRGNLEVSMLENAESVRINPA